MYVFLDYNSSKNRLSFFLDILLYSPNQMRFLWYGMLINFVNWTLSYNFTEDSKSFSDFHQYWTSYVSKNEVVNFVNIVCILQI